MSNTLKLLESTFSYIPADKGLNFIVCKEFKETFLNVYELVLAGKHIIAECVDTIDNSPVIKINIEYNNNAYDALFVLKEGDDNIIFNPTTLRHGSKILQTEKKILEELAADDIVITEVIVEDVVKPDVKLDIEKYKRDALKLIGENYIDKKSKIEDLKVGLVSLIEKNLSDIKSASVTDINIIKTQLHESVTEQVNNYKIDTDASIAEINNIRENVLATVDLYVDNIKQVVSEKTEDLTSLQESVVFSINEKIAELDLVTENHRKEVEAAFTGLSQLANNSSIQLTGMVGEIYEDVAKAKQTTIDELNAELINVTTSVNSKLKDLQSKADKKISSISKLVESKISELQVEKDKTHIELVSAKNELVTSLQEAIKTFEAETADKTAGILEIKHQFLEQVKLQSDTINATVNENKQEIQTLTAKITEAVDEKIKKINLVSTKKEDLTQLKKQLEQRIDLESANIKKVLASYGGGGSVAVQYANGGTMNGSLNVNGQILSGGVDISTFFGVGSAGGSQTLSFNENNAYLTILPNGNTVSLSALSGGNSTGVSYLSALNDVSVPTPVNGQVLTYNSITKKWNAGTPLSAAGSTGYYGSFYDTTAQTLTGANQAKRLDIANTFEANGISLSSNKIVFNNIGTYELIFSIQYKNTSSAQEDIYIWFRKNGVDIPDSSSVFTISQRKSANIPAQLIAVTPFIATLSANDFIEIYWHCNNTAVTVETFTTHTNPTIPDTPGVIITVKQVTNVQLVPTVGAYLPLSGGTLTGAVSTTNVLYTTGGNSNQWNNVYSTVQTNSANWNYQGTDVKALTANWQSNYINLSALGSVIITDVATNDLLTWNGAEWINYNFPPPPPGITDHNQLNNIQGGAVDEYYHLSLSGYNNSISVYSTVSANSGTTWNYQGTDVKSLTSNWQNTYTAFSTQSASNASVYSSFNAQSANNASVYSTVQSNSATWTGGGGGSDVSGLSANWQNTYTSFSTQSANNISVYSTTNSNSANWLNDSYDEIWIGAGAMLAPTLSGATTATMPITAAGNEIYIDSFTFDSAATKYTQFDVSLPSNCNKQSIKAKFSWTTTTSAATGNVVWGIQARVLSDTNTIDGGWGTAQECTDTISGNTTFQVSSATAVLGLSGTSSADALLLFRVYRNAPAAADTLAVNASLYGVKLQYSLAGSLSSSW